MKSMKILSVLLACAMLMSCGALASGEASGGSGGGRFLTVNANGLTVGSADFGLVDGVLPESPDAIGGIRFKAGSASVKLTVPAYDRTAPRGTGNIKAGLNYGMSLYPTLEAHSNGYAENLYLDSQSRTFVEETGGTNVLFVDVQGRLVVPVSATDSILPSITRESLVEVAGMLGIEVVRRPVRFDEVLDGEFAECGCVGTAAVISPVGKIEAEGVDVTFPNSAEEIGPVFNRLREALVGIQTCKCEDPFGWVCKIC